MLKISVHKERKKVRVCAAVWRLQQCDFILFFVANLYEAWFQVASSEWQLPN